MKKKIVIFEVEGGSDKWINGLRKDTMPMVKAIENNGWACEVIYFRDEWKDEIFTYASENFSGYISRINPGNLPNGEKIYFETLRKLHKTGLVAMSHPDEMLKLGAKDLLVKLTNTPLVPSNTFAYYDIKDFRDRFPFSLAQSYRVLKQNRGSTGVGIWKVEIWDDAQIFENEPLPLDTIVRCTEAHDNHSEIHSLDHFMKLCEKYIVGENGMLIDMPFLPRIKEGELRILMVGKKPVSVIHKKPVQLDEAFSATLFSGATYTQYKPEDFLELITFFEKYLPVIFEKIKGIQVPLIWTADFILDYDTSGKDIYILSEVNCSCVGFTEQLQTGIEEMIANEAINRVKNANLKILRK